MGKPQVDIQVDDVTGQWTVDSLPMILMPQHFFLNHHFAIEDELGPARLEELFKPAGFRSAYHWCEKEAAHHGINKIEIFHHYMRRISQRGWGQFEAIVDPITGVGHVILRNSAFVDGQTSDRGRCVCYRFASWIEGSLMYALKPTDIAHSISARECYCSADGKHDHCRFEITSDMSVEQAMLFQRRAF